MKVKWIGLLALALIAGAIAYYPAVAIAQAQQSAATEAFPRVLLVADLSEADLPGDACAEIIHLVRAAAGRGIAVQELSPGSRPDLLARYRVLAVPTVLILDENGRVVSRFEGEGRKTVSALKAKLEQLP